MQRRDRELRRHQSHNRGEVPQRGEASHVDDGARCCSALGEAARLLEQLRCRPAHELPLFMRRRSHVPHADARVAGRRGRVRTARAVVARLLLKVGCASRHRALPFHEPAPRPTCWAPPRARPLREPSQPSAIARLRKATRGTGSMARSANALWQVHLASSRCIWGLPHLRRPALSEDYLTALRSSLGRSHLHTRPRASGWSRMTHHHFSFS